MRRWVYVSETVLGDPAVLEATLQQHLPRLLADATGSPRTPREVDGSFTIHLGTQRLGVSASAPVRVATSTAARRHGRLVVPVRWRAAEVAAAFPTFSGTVELTPHTAHRATLALVGAYRAPLGPLGGVGDATLLHGAVDDTLSTLVVRLAAALQAVAGPAAAPPPEAEPEDAGAQPDAHAFARPLRVEEVMSPSPVVFDPSTSVRTAALVLASRQLAGAPIVAADGELVGVITETDLLAKAAAAPRRRSRRDAERLRRAEARTVAEAGTRPARTTVPEAPVAGAAAEMLDADVSRLVVVDHGEVVGIVSRHDVLRALLRSDDAIEAAVTDRLRAVGAAGLSVRSRWGEVALAGSVPDQAMLDDVVARLGDVDGVISVDTGEVTVTARRSAGTRRHVRAAASTAPAVSHTTGPHRGHERKAER